MEDVTIGSREANDSVVFAILLDANGFADLVVISNTMDSAFAGGDLKSVDVPSVTGSDICDVLVIVKHDLKDGSVPEIGVLDSGVLGRVSVTIRKVLDGDSEDIGILWVCLITVEDGKLGDPWDDGLGEDFACKLNGIELFVSGFLSSSS